ncbi:MAG TPA: glycosyltransferase family 4 protein [Phycisphaerae bacterium]|nr:glycosyltransferase family 4 protein [Phycisphaerae bacterium]
MRIAIIIDAVVIGGAEWQSVLSAAELTRRGEHVVLVSSYPGNDYAEFIRDRGVRLVQVAKPGGGRLSKIRALARHLRRGAFDVAHVFKGPGFSARLAAHLAGVPRVFAGYRGLTPMGLPSRWFNWAMARGTAGWIVNSGAVRRVLVERCGILAEKVHVVPNAVIASRFETRLTREEARARFGIGPDDGAVVTILANLRRVKNHAMFLRVAKRLVEGGAAARFLVAGDGPEKDALHRAAADLGVTGYVRFLGKCQQVPDLFRATDMCVLTSVSEGLPNVLIEAASAGVPCVSTDNGGAADVVVDGETGYLVKVDDDEAMAARIAAMLADPSLCEKMGRATREHVARRFSMEALGDRLLAVYRDAAGTPPDGPATGDRNGAAADRGTAMRPGAGPKGPTRS